MAESISPTALTTLQRVKDRLFDTNTGASQPSTFDTVLTRMINSVSEWVERECGGRKFVQTLYVNEIYSATGTKQLRVVLRKAPVFFSTFSGNTSVGSANITNVSNTAGLVVGMPIAGDNIPGTYVTGGNQIRNVITGISGSTVTIAAAATIAATGGYFQVNGLLNLQWRAGTPATAPSWINFIPDQFELINDGKAGIIRTYGFVPHSRDNMIRSTYYAGYTVDWPNAGNGTTHQLPADITNTVENIVVRVFKRRMIAGKGSEAVDGATTAWNREIDAEDQAVIGHYRRAPNIF